MEFVSLDLETTGFSFAMDDIIQIGAWRFRDGVSVGSFNRFIKPVRYLDGTIVQLTGITDEMLANEEGIESVLPEFYDWLGDSPVMGYNLSFDYGFLMHKGRVLGLDFSLGGKRTGYDVLKGVREKYNFSSNTLESVSKSLGILFKSESLHRADYDAYLTKLVSDRLGVLTFSNLNGSADIGSSEKSSGTLPLL